jgi:hypothetical protein
MPRRLTIEEAEERQPDLVKEQLWRGAHAKYKYHCPIHGIYEQVFAEHGRIRKNIVAGCQQCGRIAVNTPRRLTTEEMYKRHPDLVEGQESRGAGGQKYWYRCTANLGHPNYRQFFNDHGRTNANSDHEHRCPECGYLATSAAVRWSIEEIEKRHPDLVSGQQWRGNHAKYWYRCTANLGHPNYRQEYNSHEQEHGCPKCANLIKGTPRITTKEMYERHPDLVAGQECRGAGNKYWYRCLAERDHPNYRQGFSSHDGGRNCPRCRESKGEKRIADFGGYLFERQVRFDSCRNKRPLPFDFKVRGHNILIEFHGEQHYRAGKFYLSGFDFKSQKHRDRIKRNWARRNGYELIVIPYTVKNIEPFLEKRLAKYGVRVAQQQEFAMAA